MDLPLMKAMSLWIWRKKFSFEVELDDTMNLASDVDSDEEDEPLVPNEDSNKSTETASGLQLY